MGDKYFAMLKNADCIVIPLKNKNISSGQLVILQAMQLRKPIIVTDGDGIRDYIKNGYNGITIKNNKDELLQALEQIENKEIRNTIVSNAYKEYDNKYSLKSLGKNIGKIVMETEKKY